MQFTGFCIYVLYPSIHLNEVQSLKHSILSLILYCEDIYVFQLVAACEC